MVAMKLACCFADWCFMLFFQIPYYSFFQLSAFSHMLYATPLPMGLVTQFVSSCSSLLYCLSPGSVPFVPPRQGRSSLRGTPVLASLILQIPYVATLLIFLFEKLNSRNQENFNESQKKILYCS